MIIFGKVLFPIMQGNLDRIIVVLKMKKSEQRSVNMEERGADRRLFLK